MAIKIQENVYNLAYYQHRSSRSSISFGYTLGFDNGASSENGKKYSLKIGIFNRQGEKIHSLSKYLYTMDDHPRHAVDYVKRISDTLKQAVKESQAILESKIPDPIDRNTLDNVVGIVPSIVVDGKTAVVFPNIKDINGQPLKDIPLSNIKHELGTLNTLFVHDAQAFGFTALKYLGEQGILQNKNRTIGVHYPGGGYARFDADILDGNILAKSMEDQHVLYKNGESIEKFAVSESGVLKNFVKAYNNLTGPNDYKISFEEVQKRGLGAKFLSDQIVYGTEKAQRSAIHAVDEMIRGIVQIVGTSVLKATDTVVVFGKIVGGFKKALNQSKVDGSFEERMEKALNQFLQETGPGPLHRALNQTKLFIADINPDSLDSIPQLAKAKSVPGKPAWLTVPVKIFEKLSKI